MGPASASSLLHTPCRRFLSSPKKQSAGFFWYSPDRTLLTAAKRAPSHGVADVSCKRVARSSSPSSVVPFPFPSTPGWRRTRHKQKNLLRPNYYEQGTWRFALVRSLQELGGLDTVSLLCQRQQTALQHPSGSHAVQGRAWRVASSKVSDVTPPSEGRGGGTLLRVFQFSWTT